MAAIVVKLNILPAVCYIHYRNLKNVQVFYVAWLC